MNGKVWQQEEGEDSTRFLGSENNNLHIKVSKCMYIHSRFWIESTYVVKALSVGLGNYYIHRGIQIIITQGKRGISESKTLLET